MDTDTQTDLRTLIDAPGKLNATLDQLKGVRVHEAWTVSEVAHLMETNIRRGARFSGLKRDFAFALMKHFGVDTSNEMAPELKDKAREADRMVEKRWPDILDGLYNGSVEEVAQMVENRWPELTPKDVSQVVWYCAWRESKASYSAISASAQEQAAAD